MAGNHFDDSEHPRGQPSNSGQFRAADPTPGEAVLHQSEDRGRTRGETPESKKIANWEATQASFRTMFGEASEIASFGQEVYFSDTPQGRIIRRSSKSLVIDLGNAAWYTPQVEQDRRPEVPWKDLKATRDRISHTYLATDYRIIWGIVSVDIEKLRSAFDVGE